MAELVKASKWPFIGLGALACMGFAYGASTFLAWWGHALLYLAWIPLVVVALISFGPRPRMTTAAGVISVLLWLGAYALVAVSR